MFEPHFLTITLNKGSRYDNLSLEACLSGAQFQRCRVGECNSGQQCFPEDSYMICRDCGGRTCIACDTPWHPGVFCPDVQGRRTEERNSEENAAAQYLEKKSKLCPKCQIRGQRIGGCDHMTCKISWTALLPDIY